MKGSAITRAAAVLWCGALLGSIAAPGYAQSGAPLNVLAAAAVKAAFDELVPLYEKTSGQKIAVHFDGVGAIAKMAATGEGYDVVVSRAAAIGDLVKAGYVMPDTQTIVGTAIASLAYRHGAPVPDLSSPATLKAVVLGAKSISYADPALGAASSMYFMSVIQPLGISDVVAQKAIVTKPGEGAFPVGSGQADIGIAQSSEIALVPGVDGVPIVPSNPASKTTYAAAVASKASLPVAARAFVRFLQSPEAAAILKTKGLGAS